MQTEVAPQITKRQGAFFIVLAAISFCHLLNDMVQSLIIAIYPILKTSFHLSFVQIGLITLTYQVTASLLQPLVGLYADHKPTPYSLPVGMGVTLCGLLFLATASSFAGLLLAGALVGVGSSVFHPESSRVARFASGGRHGLAQSLFQVGGNAGSSLGPLLAAFIVVPRGQGSIAWFSIAALLGILILTNVGHWYKQQSRNKAAGSHHYEAKQPTVERKVLFLSMTILVALMFSKFFYLASLSSYYTFYLIAKFHVPVKTFAALSIPVLSFHCGRNDHRRSNRRQVRSAISDLVLHFGSLAVHVAAAVRESILDRGLKRRHRPNLVICLLGHFGVCAGFNARPRWHGVRYLFRIGIRAGRRRCRSFGQSG